MDGISRILCRKPKFPVAAISLSAACATEAGDPLSRSAGLRLLPGSVRLSPGARRHAPCSVLHRRRFFVPRRLRAGRWALTPPFHPCPMTQNAPPGGLFSVTLSVAASFRRKRPRLLRGLLPVWCPDFPLAGRNPPAAAGRPAVKLRISGRVSRRVARLDRFHASVIGRKPFNAKILRITAMKCAHMAR